MVFFNVHSGLRVSILIDIASAAYPGGQGEIAMSIGQHSHRRIKNDRRVRQILLIATAVVGLVGFLLAAPVALLAMGSLGLDNWSQLSMIGEAYGGVAAIVGMFAVVGVAVSIAIQSRESAANREVFHRTFHTDLLLRALDDESLRECWGLSVHGNADHDRQHVYTNLIVSFWRSLYLVGKMSDEELRVVSATMFSAAPGRRYWASVRTHHLERHLTERDSHFVRILESQFWSAQE